MADGIFRPARYALRDAVSAVRLARCRFARAFLSCGIQARQNRDGLLTPVWCVTVHNAGGDGSGAGVFAGKGGKGMRVLITGGAGFLGRHLCAALLTRGDEVSVASRRPGTVGSLCGPKVRPVADDFAARLAREPFDAVIHLAGAPVFDRRWRTARKTGLWESRVTSTRRLVEGIAGAFARPAVLLSASATGYYGDRADEVLDESAAHGRDFLGRLCTAWEAAAEEARGSGVRVCRLRTGMVLDASGGALRRMVPPFRMGWGARLGDGRQWVSWIHIGDWVGLVLRLLDDARAAGPFNLTAPQPVRQAEFAATLGALLRRPVRCAVPGWLLRAGLGERAALLLASQRVVPAAALARGHAFRYPDLEGALRSLIGHPASGTVSR